MLVDQENCQVSRVAHDLVAGWVAHAPTGQADLNRLRQNIPRSQGALYLAYDGGNALYLAYDGGTASNVIYLA